MCLECWTYSFHINDLKQLDPKKVNCVKMEPFRGVTYFLKVGQGPEVHVSTSSKLPVHALIHDPKKSCMHQLGPMTHFLANQNFDPLPYTFGRGSCSYIYKASCKFPN